MTDSVDADAATRPREARYAEALAEYADLDGAGLDFTGYARAVMAVADAEQAELRAEVERWVGAWRGCDRAWAKDRAEVERLREDLRIEVDLHEEMTARWVGLREGIGALADEWAYKGEFGWGAWQEGEGPDPEGYVLDRASSTLRALLAPAPAATTGEAGGSGE